MQGFEGARICLLVRQGRAEITGWTHERFLQSQTDLVVDHRHRGGDRVVADLRTMA